MLVCSEASQPGAKNMVVFGGYSCYLTLFEGSDAAPFVFTGWSWPMRFSRVAVLMLCGRLWSQLRPGTNTWLSLRFWTAHLVHLMKWHLLKGSWTSIQCHFWPCAPWTLLFVMKMKGSLQRVTSVKELRKHTVNEYMTRPAGYGCQLWKTLSLKG